jgi:hypothetical protein
MLSQGMWAEVDVGKHMPCGSPEVTLSVAPLTIFDERRAEVPIGAISQAFFSFSFRGFSFSILVKFACGADV